MLHCIKPWVLDATSGTRDPQDDLGGWAMSAPLTKAQMAFELPRLSYIHTLTEEPAATPRPEQGFGIWLKGRIEAFRLWRESQRALADLSGMTDRELSDVGLTRADCARLFDNRLNVDLRTRVRAF
jgi:uncharacterized protein YjiS (DUF1127 family)